MGVNVGYAGGVSEVLGEVTVMHRLRYFLVVGVVLSACASGGTSDVAREGTGPLMGLESQRHRAPWAEWRPAPGRSVPAGLERTMVMFDGWRTSEKGLVTETWRGLFPVLDRISLRRDVGEEVSRASRAAMHLLEPGGDVGSPVVLEATYLVRPENFEGSRREGLALRFYRQVANSKETSAKDNASSESSDSTAASVTVWMTRQPTGPRTPDHIIIWANSGFQEGKSMTAVFERQSTKSTVTPEKTESDPRWRTAMLAAGLKMPPVWDEEAAGAKSASDNQPVQLVQTILVDNLWKPHVGPSYAASTRRPDDATQPPAPMQPFLGLPNKGRGIQRVYSGSVFPPRPDGDWSP